MMSIIITPSANRAAKLRYRLQTWWRILALVCSGLFGILVALTGVTDSLQRVLSEVSAGLRRHPASASLLIVEIDARSIASVDRWPWPRRDYAQAVDRLRAAGARSIAFDVDFSSASTPADDAAFAAALQRAGGRVVLPTFSQKAGSKETEWKDSLPIASLRDHATLAAVSILPERDGAIRRAPIGTITADVARPSLSAILAGVSGAADTDFPIDFAIDPATIPRFSYLDVRDGKFDERSIRGKDVLIGATAVELGDRYVVPNYGILPGVVIQAMAAETLHQGIPKEGGWVIPLLLALNLAWLILNLRESGLLAATVIASPLLLFALSIILAEHLHWIFAITPALAAMAAASVCKYAMRAAGAARYRLLHDAETGLPNRLAMKHSPQPTQAIVAARLSNYEKLVSGIGEDGIPALVCRIQERIALVTSATVFRVSDRVLAWEYSEDIEASLFTLRTLMMNAVEVAGRRVDVTLNYGMAARRSEENSEQVLSRALLAADQAIDQGDAWRFYDDADDGTVDRELSLLSELDDAIIHGDIEVFYQPKLCLRTNKIDSLEALVRWNHATRGRLGPDQFIPLAERSGRIDSLTLYVLKRTIRDIQAWHSIGFDVSGAINFSAKLLTSTTFLADLRSVVESSAIRADRLIFEVTESAAMTDTMAAAEALRSFQTMGIAISMDDYGTGQSTLSYLRQLPLNELKMDRSFVQFAHRNRSDAVLVQSTINLAHELGLRVVAEGVEEDDCMTFLQRSGCDLIQGYLISRPVPAKEITSLLVQRYFAAPHQAPNDGRCAV